MTLVCVLCCSLPVVAHTPNPSEEGTSPSFSRAVIWYVEHSYMLYSFQAMHGEKKGRKEKRKKEGRSMEQSKIVASDFLEFEKQ